MSAKKVLILGAGACGSIVANKLARELRREIAKGEIEITLLDRDEISVNQAGFTFVPYGLYTKEDIMKPRRKFISPRVKSFFGSDGEVERVDLPNRRVITKSGRTYSYDYLLIATGCRGVAEEIKGLSRDFNTFYTSLEDTLKLKKLIEEFKGGKIVILTVSMPIPCPGAPSKFTILLDEYLRYVKGEEIRKKTEITFLWPIKLIGPPAYNSLVEKVFEEKEIQTRREFSLSEIDEGRKEVVSADGERIKYDLLVTVPPHKSAQSLINSGITDEKGWVPADKYTLQYAKSPTERYDEVYVAGDTGPAEILKTGVGAHYQGLIVGQNLINDLLGIGAKVPYRGETGCPFVGSMYTTYKRGMAYLASWTYDRPLKPFAPTELGWFIYRIYYYIYWDSTVKALM
ncbi:NAD(P)/FAD-dependent oxidoreductase [Candidatus Geothermarchaeota archaeon]|nr:MAG: NAD(P)/FAD-dependent oxidoreductase [Candidatus Geothermarchaeota archaeon]